MIPIFDSEAYWGKCVNSIVNQTYRKIRILLVDDSSSDNSVIMCNKLIEKVNV